MTIWDNIYQHFKKTGEEYATLKPNLLPEFLEFMNTYTFTTKSALDIGCGNGKYLVYLKDHGFTVSGIDSSPTAVEMTKEAVGLEASIICTDMYTYQYTAFQYDLVLSIAAMHHGLKKQVQTVVKGIYTSLLPNGMFFVTLPDNEGSSHWVTMSNHEEIEPGVRVPLEGPEKGLPHSSFTKDELNIMFSQFKDVTFTLLSERGRWIVMGKK